MANFKQTSRKIGKFLKKNGYIFLIVICIAAIGTMIGIVVANNNKPDAVIETPVDRDDNDKQPVDGNEDNDEDKDKDNPGVQPITFIAPSTGTVGEEMDYTTVSLYYNQTLNEYKVHQGIDFCSETDANVYAVCDGVVTEVVVDDVLLGHYVIIQHDENYVSKYYSLDKDIKVIVGQTVSKNDVLGVMSTSLETESATGAHLHFEMTKDDVTIDPLTVIVLNEK